MNKREDAIIRYLTDEMTQEEKTQFEQQLAEDPTLEGEVREFEATQRALQSWPDAAFEVPPLAEFHPENKPRLAKLSAVGVPKWMSYAAAVLFLLGFAWLSDLQIAQKDNALILSFGPPQQAPSYDTEQVAQIVDLAVAKYATQANEGKNKEEALDQRFAQLEKTVSSRLAALYQKDLNEIQQHLSDHERKQLIATEELVRGLQFEQRVLLQEAIVAVLDRIEQQRLEDRIGLENAFEQITTLLSEMQNGGTTVVDGLTDVKVKHY